MPSEYPAARAKYRASEKGKERHRQESVRYYRSHREKCLARARRWREEHREAYRLMSLRSAHRRMARLRAAFVEDVDLVDLGNRDGWLCGVCHVDVMPADASLDHVFPVSKGGEHSYANAQLAHLRCNQRKNAKVVLRLKC